MRLVRNAWGAVSLSAALALSAILPVVADPGDSPFDRLKDRLEGALERLADAVATKPQPEPPEWARADGKPILTFAQIADVHYDGAHREDLDRALAFLDRTIRPGFVLFAGDNVSCAWELNAENLRKLSAIVDAGLSMPWYMVKGDNDSEGYEEALDSSNWSFDAGGIHFVGIGFDRDIEGTGMGYLSDPGWLLDDLAAARGRPAILLLHEPFVPPTCVEAFRLGVRLAAEDDLVAVLTGHLHKDVSARVGRITHITAPAIGRTHAGRGIKVYEVHPGHITVKTWEVRGGAYAFADKWQHIPFPRRLRLAKDASPAIADFRFGPAMPTKFANMPDGTRDPESWLSRTTRRWQEALQGSPRLPRKEKSRDPKRDARGPI